MKRYQQIVESDLGITNSFLCDKEREKTIVERLVAANKELNKEPDSILSPEMLGINQCIHLASSIVLLGSTKDAISKTRDRIHHEYKVEGDAALLISVAVLMYVAEKLTAKTKFNYPYAEITNIVNHFSSINWLIGGKSIQFLNSDV